MLLNQSNYSIFKVAASVHSQETNRQEPLHFQVSRYFHRKCRRSSKFLVFFFFFFKGILQRSTIRLEEIVRNRTKSIRKTLPGAFVYKSKYQLVSLDRSAIDTLSLSLSREVWSSVKISASYAESNLRARQKDRTVEEDGRWTISIKSTRRSAREQEEERIARKTQPRSRRGENKRATRGGKPATQGGARSRWESAIGSETRWCRRRRRDRRHEPNWWQLGSVNWPANVPGYQDRRSDRRKVKSGST